MELAIYKGRQAKIEMVKLIEKGLVVVGRFLFSILLLTLCHSNIQTFEIQNGFNQQV